MVNWVLFLVFGLPLRDYKLRPPTKLYIYTMDRKTMKISNFKCFAVMMFCFFMSLSFAVEKNLYFSDVSLKSSVSLHNSKNDDKSDVHYMDTSSRKFSFLSPGKIMILALMAMGDPVSCYSPPGSPCDLVGCKVYYVPTCINGYQTKTYAGCSDKCLDCPGWEEAKQVHDNMWANSSVAHIKNRTYIH